MNSTILRSLCPALLVTLGLLCSCTTRPTANKASVEEWLGSSGMKPSPELVQLMSRKVEWFGNNPITYAEAVGILFEGFRRVAYSPTLGPHRIVLSKGAMITGTELQRISSGMDVALSPDGNVLYVSEKNKADRARRMAKTLSEVDDVTLRAQLPEFCCTDGLHINDLLEYLNGVRMETLGTNAQPVIQVTSRLNKEQTQGILAPFWMEDVSILSAIWVLVVHSEADIQVSSQLIQIVPSTRRPE